MPNTRHVSRRNATTVFGNVPLRELHPLNRSSKPLHLSSVRATIMCRLQQPFLSSTDARAGDVDLGAHPVPPLVHRRVEDGIRRLRRRLKQSKAALLAVEAFKTKLAASLREFLVAGAVARTPAGNSPAGLSDF